MNDKEFRDYGMLMADYILDYMDTISDKPVVPRVEPGFLSKVLPADPPEKGESFERVLEDFDKNVMPGMIHWEHPRFHAYFPACSSFPSILAEVVSDAVGCAGFNWNLSPAGEELEAVVTDWYGRLMGLPDQFLRYADGSKGGGIIQNSSSECVLVCLLAARDQALEKLMLEDPSADRAGLLSTLMAYCSEEAHSCVEKAAILSLVNIRILEVDDGYRLRGGTLSRAVEEDKQRGLVPFYVCLTIGTTSSCSCDPVHEAGPVCERHGMWLHVDAAYAGTAMACPEFRSHLEGIEHAASYNVNAGKWLMVNLECAVLFVNDRSKVGDSVVNDRTVFRYGNDAACPTTRRCRGFKLWFVLSTYGAEGVRSHVRNHVCLARTFAQYVEKDRRFELIQCRFGLVCFRLVGSNTLNARFLKAINDAFKLLIIATCLRGRFVLRFCVCYFGAREDDILYAWNVIEGAATDVLKAGAMPYTRNIEYDPSIDNFFS